MTRTQARAHAMQLIYEWEMGGEGGEETRFGLIEVKPDEEETDFMNRAFEGVVKDCAALDEKIAQFSRGWKLERITRVDLAILRLGAYELRQGEVPSGIAISEAVELAKAYSSEKAGNFVNGVLGSIARDMEA